MVHASMMYDAKLFGIIVKRQIFGFSNYVANFSKELLKRATKKYKCKSNKKYNCKSNKKYKCKSDKKYKCKSDNKYKCKGNKKYTSNKKV